MDSGDSEDHLRNLEQSVSQDKWFREEMIQKFHCDKLYIIIYQRCWHRTFFHSIDMNLKRQKKSVVVIKL